MPRPAARRDYFDNLGYEASLSEKASIVLLQDGQLVGFVYVMPHGEDNRHISCMCIMPELQGRGLGRLLLDLVMVQLRHEGFKSLTLGTETEMRAYDPYLKNGFQVTDRAIINTWDNPT